MSAIIPESFHTILLRSIEVIQEYMLKMHILILTILKLTDYYKMEMVHNLLYID